MLLKWEIASQILQQEQCFDLCEANKGLLVSGICNTLNRNLHLQWHLDLEKKSLEKIDNLINPVLRDFCHGQRITQMELHKILCPNILGVKKAKVVWIFLFEDLLSGSLLHDAAIASLPLVHNCAFQSFLSRKELAVPPVHLTPVFLLALLAAVIDLAASRAPPQRAASWVQLVPTK